MAHLAGLVIVRGVHVEDHVADGGVAHAGDVEARVGGHGHAAHPACLIARDLQVLLLDDLHLLVACGGAGSRRRGVSLSTAACVCQKST